MFDLEKLRKMLIQHTVFICPAVKIEAIFFKIHRQLIKKKDKFFRSCCKFTFMRKRQQKKAHLQEKTKHLYCSCLSLTQKLNGRFEVC